MYAHSKIEYISIFAIPFTSGFANPYDALFANPEPDHEGHHEAAASRDTEQHLPDTHPEGQMMSIL